VEMFVQQGVRQFEIFTGKPAPEEEMFRVVLHALRQSNEPAAPSEPSAPSIPPSAQAQAASKASDGHSTPKPGQTPATKTAAKKTKSK
jgi:3-dehydroquinate dehydratase/shikimate dehydrogenase